MNKRDQKALDKKNESLTKAALQVSTETSETTNNPFKKKNSTIVLKADYRDDWCERTSFEVCDAAKGPEKYADD